ncbi:unnamed protein product [Hanseniaspora opuntiae]
MLTKQLLLAGALLTAVQGIYLNTTSTTSASSTTSSTPTATGLPSSDDFSFSGNTIADGVANFGFKLDLGGYAFSYGYVNTTDSPIDLIENSEALTFFSESGNTTAGSASGTFTTDGFFLTLGGSSGDPDALSFYYKGSTSDASASQTFDLWLPVLGSKRALQTYVKYTITAVADANGGSGSVVITTVTVDLTASSSSTSATTSTTSATSNTTTSTGASSTGVEVSTTSVSSETTTLVTITSCEDNKCSTTTSPAWVSVATTTIEGTVTDYTTYCPISSETEQWSTSTTVKPTETTSGPGWTSTKVTTITTKVPVSSGTEAGSVITISTGAKSGSVTTVGAETESASLITVSSGASKTTAAVSTYEAWCCQGCRAISLGWSTILVVIRILKDKKLKSDNN